MKIRIEVEKIICLLGKLLFLCSLIFVSERLAAEDRSSALEQIWRRIINYNSEVLSARKNEEIAGINQDYYWLSFVPSV